MMERTKAREEEQCLCEREVEGKKVEFGTEVLKGEGEGDLRWKDGWMDGWMDVWMDGWMDGIAGRWR